MTKIRYTYEEVLPLARTFSFQTLNVFMAYKGRRGVCFMKKLIDIVGCRDNHGELHPSVITRLDEIYEVSQVPFEELPLMLNIGIGLSNRIVQHRLTTGK